MADQFHVVGTNRYAVDELGVRRFVRAGAEIPPGWKLEPEPKEPTPKPKPKKAAD